MANIHYIRAAIHENTGIDLPLEEVVELLLEEQMLTHKEAQRMIMKDYSSYYGKEYDDYEVLVDEVQEDEETDDES